MIGIWVTQLCIFVKTLRTVSLTSMYSTYVNFIKDEKIHQKMITMNCLYWTQNPQSHLGGSSTFFFSGKDPYCGQQLTVSCSLCLHSSQGTGTWDWVDSKGQSLNLRDRCCGFHHCSLSSSWAAPDLGQQVARWSLPPPQPPVHLPLR